jgi:hypothetical protein
MSLVGSYSVTGATATTLSRYYSTIDELLLGLPDNTNNLIQAINIRDAVYSLYQIVGNVSASASSTASVTYDRNLPSTYVGNVGGVNQGSTFSGTIQDALDRVFYPYVSPFSSISLINSPREFGSPISVTLNWSVTKNSNSITTISVASIPQVPTGNSQTGTLVSTGTHSSTPSISQTNTFTINTTDGTTPSSSSTQLVWMNRVFWGSVDLSSIGNPNLTTNPGSASLVASLCDDNTIVNNNDGPNFGANANGLSYGSLLSTTKNRSFLDIDGAGDYLIFAWPSNVSGSLTPNFAVNGLPNTAFTRVRTSSPLVNVWGFSGTNYEVWVSNTRQNSPLNIVIS